MALSNVDKLSDYYVAAATKFHGRDTRINRATMSWAFKGMLRDMSLAQIKQLIDFYFTSYAHKEHDFTTFQYSYDKIEMAMREREREVKHIETLRAESAQRAKEWRAKRERIAGNRSDSE